VRRLARRLGHRAAAGLPAAADDGASVAANPDTAVDADESGAAHADSSFDADAPAHCGRATGSVAATGTGA
jgi:hypothetical protein